MLNKRPINTRWLVGLLVALNVFTLAALFFSRGRRADRRPDTMGLFCRELGLADEQAEQFKQLRQAHFERTRPLFKELRAVQQKMIESLGDAPADSLALRHFTAERTQVMGRIDSLLARHYLDLRAVCAPEQQDKLEAVFLRAMWAGKGKGHGRSERD